VKSYQYFQREKEKRDAILLLYAIILNVHLIITCIAAYYFQIWMQDFTNQLVMHTYCSGIPV
jgi:hypothetical protein